jgi:cysteine-rich repeat protein
VECTDNANCPDDGEICNGDEYCNPETHVCDRRDPPPDGTRCGDADRYLCIDQVCVLSRCGDGFQDTGNEEQCDDGNTASGDGCSADCRIESGVHCGDGTQDCDEDEACDDGNTTAGDGCSPTCRFEPLPPPSCGDGTVDAALETCDDGNAGNGDACNPTCNFANTTTLFIGQPGTGGYANGTGTAARITGAGGFALCGNHLYLADTSANLVRVIDIPTASITTIAGDAENGASGYADSTNGLEARFDNPTALATDGSTLWVADTMNFRIRAIDLTSPSTPVTTVAGSGITGHVDGVGTSAQLDTVRGMAYYNGYVYFVDSMAATLRRFDPVTAEVVTIAGLPYTTGGTDGIGVAARFNSPRFVISNFTGKLYISDASGARIRVFDIATNAVSTFAGNGASEYVDGTGGAVRVQQPRGIAYDGSSLYWVEFDAHTVRQGILSTVSVSTMVGTRDSAGYVEGVGTAALFSAPYEMAFHFPTNSLFVLDAGNYVIRRIQ